MDIGTHCLFESPARALLGSGGGLCLFVAGQVQDEQSAADAGGIAEPCELEGNVPAVITDQG